MPVSHAVPSKVLLIVSSTTLCFVARTKIHAVNAKLLDETGDSVGQHNGIVLGKVVWRRGQLCSTPYDEHHLCDITGLW